MSLENGVGSDAMGTNQATEVDLAATLVKDFKDGDFVHLPANQLLDMVGGNIRHSRSGWDELVYSVKSQGIIQPVVARLMPDHTFQLLAGYGRRDAAVAAGLTTVPTIVRIVDDATALELHFIENFNRSEISFASQVTFARRFMSFHNDAQSAASKLGWSLVMFRERLSLSTCVDPVLIALDEGKITVRHALILASFDSNIQKNTLLKCVAEQWSVAELKLRADKVQIPLSKAIFDQSECFNCPNNTQAQSGLFGFEDTAKCSKSSCYKDKTKNHLEVLKAQAEERYGTVLWLSQSLECDRQTVAASVVGETQFLTGCTSCTDRVAVMDDSIVGNSGAIIESQCTRKACLTACIKAFESSKLPPVVEDVKPVQATDVTTADVATNPKLTKEKKTVAANDEGTAHVGSVSSVVVEKHQVEALIASREALKGNKTFKLALHLVSLISMTGFKVLSSIPNAIGVLMKKPEEELLKMIEEVELFAITKTTSFQSTTPAHLVLTSAVMSMDEGFDTLVKAWTPTADILGSYTTSGVIAIGILSGLEKHVDAKEAGAFKKITKGNKGDVIKAIQIGRASCREIV